MGKERAGPTGVKHSEKVTASLPLQNGRGGNGSYKYLFKNQLHFKNMKSSFFVRRLRLMFD